MGCTQTQKRKRYRGMASLSFENAIALNYQNLFWDRIYPSILLLSVKCYSITLQQLNRIFFRYVANFPVHWLFFIARTISQCKQCDTHALQKKNIFFWFGRRLPSTMPDLTPQHLSQWPVDYASTGMLYYSVHLPFQQTDTVQYPFTTCFVFCFVT